MVKIFYILYFIIFIIFDFINNLFTVNKLFLISYEILTLIIIAKAEKNYEIHVGKNIKLIGVICFVLFFIRIFMEKLPYFSNIQSNSHGMGIVLSSLSIVCIFKILKVKG